MSNPIEEISTSMIERYSNRYNQMGYDVKTLGWGSKEQQVLRFRQATSAINFDQPKSVLDIGCGFGDLFALLLADKKPITKFIGWDINPDLIGEATNIWQSAEVPNEFSVVNLANHICEKPLADIGFMFGVLNLNFKDNFDNYAYSKLFIKNALSAVKEVLVVDFLSTHLTPTYPKEDFVFYHDPIKILEFAFTLTSNVVLKHNYGPIPQKEFMLFLYK
jgi:SAM-dependent methyltransferase